MIDRVTVRPDFDEEQLKLIDFLAKLSDREVVFVDENNVQIPKKRLLEEVKRIDINRLPKFTKESINIETLIDPLEFDLHEILGIENVSTSKVTVVYHNRIDPHDLFLSLNGYNIPPQTNGNIISLYQGNYSSIEDYAFTLVNLNEKDVMKSNYYQSDGMIILLDTKRLDHTIDTMGKLLPKIYEKKWNMPVILVFGNVNTPKEESYVNKLQNHFLSQYGSLIDFAQVSAFDHLQNRDIVKGIFDKLAQKIHR